MNDITPKEANEILSHYTDLGYGIVIEGEDTSKIKHALSLASKVLANGIPITEGDLIMFRTLMTEIANKGLPFEEVLLLIDNAKTPTEGDCISRKQVLDELMAHQYSQDFCKEHGIEYSINSSMVRIIVNGAQTVQPKYSLLPLECTDMEDAFNRGYRAGKIEGILKANTRPQGGAK